MCLIARKEAAVSKNDEQFESARTVEPSREQLLFSTTSTHYTKEPFAT
jgi:hypothetical protein